MKYDPEVLLQVLIYHQHRVDSSCICGWARLGYSHPKHVIEIYEQTMRLEGDEE